MVITRLKGDISRHTAGIINRLQRHDFCVGLSNRLGKTGGGNCVLLHQHAPHRRIWYRPKAATTTYLNRMLHEHAIAL
jgi:hypothetical protein